MSRLASRAAASPAPRGWASIYTTIRNTPPASRRLYSYSRGVRSWSVNDFPDAYQAFQNSGFRLRALLKNMVLSDSFYAAAPRATCKGSSIEIKGDLMNSIADLSPRLVPGALWP